MALFPDADRKKARDADENDEVERGAFNGCVGDALLASWHCDDAGIAAAPPPPGMRSSVRADPVAVSSSEGLSVAAIDRERHMGPPGVVRIRYVATANATGLARLGRVSLFDRTSGCYFHVGASLQVVVVDEHEDS